MLFIYLLTCFWLRGRCLRHVDLPSDESGGVVLTAAHDLIAMLATDGGGRCAYGEPEVCLRGGKVFAPRLEEGRCVRFCVHVPASI